MPRDVDLGMMGKAVSYSGLIPAARDAIFTSSGISIIERYGSSSVFLCAALVSLLNNSHGTDEYYTGQDQLRQPRFGKELH